MGDRQHHRHLLAPGAAGRRGATIDTNGNAVRFATGLTGSGGLTKNGGGALFLLANNTYTGGTTVNGGILHIGAEGGPPGSIVGTVTVNGDDSHIAFLSTSSAGNLAITLNGGTGHFFGNSTGANATITANSASTWFVEQSGSGGQARFIVNAGGAFDISPMALSGTTAGSIEGAGAFRLGSKQLSVGANNLSTTVSGVIADGGRNGGTGGSLVKVGTGTLTLTGANTFTGGATVNAGGLVVNGSLASSVTLNDGTLGGSGTIGGLVANGGMLAPGNSIGTLNVGGNFAQNGGIYVVEANAQGQSDRVNVTGTATINGGTVQLVAAPGNYGTSTTYTILNATGGVTGAYSSVSSNFAFLTPTLSYNANNVFLTLALQGNAFSGFGGNTVNQRAVGYALDQTFANASGDFATVINALAGLSTTQAPAALDAISGQPYADFGTTNVANASLFMNTLGQQMALARGGSAPGARVALAQACDVEACDEARPLSAWFSGLGGLGSVQGDGNSSTLTYNVGGAAAGIDYRFDPRFLVGLGVGYTHGTQWVNSFMGQGWTDSVSVAAYGSFTLRRASMPTRWSATPISTTRCSGRSRSRACSNARPRAARVPTSSWRRSRPATSSASGRWDHSHRLRASRLRARHRTRSPNRVRARSISTSRSRRRTRFVPCWARSSAAASPLEPCARWASAFAWAGSMSTPTPAGRSRRRSPVRRQRHSPSTAPRRRATPRSSASRPRPASRRRRSSTCATTASSPGAPTITRSRPACA